MKYLITAFVATLCLYAIAKSDADSISQCEKIHSYDVCFHELN